MAPWIFPLLFALAAAPAPGVAQVTSSSAFPPAFPSRPVRLVVGLSAGAQTDTIARLLGQKLSERWG